MGSRGPDELRVRRCCPHVGGANDDGFVEVRLFFEAYVKSFADLEIKVAFEEALSPGDEGIINGLSWDPPFRRSAVGGCANKDWKWHGGGGASKPKPNPDWITVEEWAEATSYGSTAEEVAHGHHHKKQDSEQDKEQDNE